MMPDAIARFRRFSRAVTREVGALDDSFLGRGRPLGAARVLNAVGHGHADLSGLRDYLGLDSGLLSRLLRGLQADGLIVTEPGRGDGRRRVAALTPAGREEFAAYEALSNTHAAGVLARSPRPEALLAAMDLVATAFGRDRIVLRRLSPSDPAAVRCLSAYYAELAARFPEGYDVSLSCDPEAADMTAPRGTFLVAMSDALPLGCVGLKGDGGAVAEIKRLWVAPSARGLGLGRRLMAAAEDAARGLGIETLRLDSHGVLVEGLALYRAAGWTQIERFNDDPYPEFFFEKRL